MIYLDFRFRKSVNVTTISRERGNDNGFYDENQAGSTIADQEGLSTGRYGGDDRIQ